MYSKQEAALIRKDFWTRFGQYMKRLPGADGQAVNWLNYKTGIRSFHFRMDVDNKQARIAIEIRHPDATSRMIYYQKLYSLKGVLQRVTGDKWEWEPAIADEDGSSLSRISKTMPFVNILNTADWPAIISFFKPRIILLDEFWSLVKEGFL